MKEEERGILACLPLSRAKRGFTPLETIGRRQKANVSLTGFTLIEILVSACILAIVFAGLFTTLSTGNYSHSVSSAKVDLQAKVRMILGWIIKDVRETNLIEINSNNPSIDHIKFKKVAGNNSDGSYATTENYTEYSYDSAALTLTRREVAEDGSILQSWTFADITEAAFYVDAAADPRVPLLGSPTNNILTYKKLDVIVSGQNQVRGLTLNWTLAGEARIRNE